MNAMKIISVYVKTLSSRFREYIAIRRRLSFLNGITDTQAFSKLSLSDKVTSLAKLIMISQSVYGIVPKELEKKLLRLSSDLRRRELKQLISHG